MRLRVTVENISPNGTCDVRSNDHDKDELTIGRGAGCDILLSDSSVSLVHAKIISRPRETQGGMGVFVEDQASLSGVLVNKRPVARHELVLGDVLSFGSVQFTVRATEGVIELFRQKRGETLDLDAKIRRDVQELHVARKLPSFQLLNLSIVAVVLAVYFVLPVLTERRASWSSGPIESSHKMIEHNCQSCHEGQFSRISDEKCLACHTMSDHAKPFTAHAALRDGVEPSCATCHMDHNGSSHGSVGDSGAIGKAHGLIVHQSALCTDCHARIDSVLAPLNEKASVAVVTGFDDHPEFSVTLQSLPGTPGPGLSLFGVTLPGAPAEKTRRVRLDDPAKLKDVSNIKLNHKVHLEKDLRTRTGQKTLDCGYCHGLNDDFRTVERISFEKHCQECHSLEFDERLPRVEVPHGDPNVVYRFLYAEYAKLLLSSEKVSPIRREFQQRGGRIPGKASIEAVQQAQSADDFSRSFVEKESRGSERVLFTRTACFLCHAVEEKKISEAEIRENATSRFKILEPQIPERWMPASIFSHGSHEEVGCEDCHAGVRQSTRTTDVLLPKIDSCRSCHVEHPEVGKVTSDCVLCHSYHNSLAMPFERKRSVSDIILGLGL